jgi:succinate dehydrogenase/fumarate reductase flavoprotein subunit
VDKDGNESEFLYEKLGAESLGLIFLKGYQWPFDTRKTQGSSKVDLLVAEEIKQGKRVYLDFLHNPKGLEGGFEVLPKEAYEYLERSGALFGTPIERLKKMNEGAIELYQSHNIDLYQEYLEIAVCAQHCNGGVAVDANWESRIKGLFVAGEAAGTFGVYRPGGSALNATQVGSLRAAERIASQERDGRAAPKFDLPDIRYGKSNLASIREKYQWQMSKCADFDRFTKGMEALFAEASELCDRFFEEAVIGDASEIFELFKLYDMILTQCAVLSAMLLSAREIGSHGSALVDRKENCNAEQRMTRTLTKGRESYLAPISKMPNPELWFETLLARKRNTK